jgi:hypothetical protein
VFQLADRLASTRGTGSFIVTSHCVHLVLTQSAMYGVLLINGLGVSSGSGGGVAEVHPRLQLQANIEISLTFCSDHQHRATDPTLSL